jgi:hypothetical protein
LKIPKGNSKMDNPDKSLKIPKGHSTMDNPEKSLKISKMRILYSRFLTGLPFQGHHYKISYNKHPDQHYY